MTDMMQPPTDNLYKFVAIGGLVLTIVAFVFIFRQQSEFQAEYVAAQIDLLAHGYDSGKAPPTDLEMRRAYFRRQVAQAEIDGLSKLAGGFLGKTVAWSVSFSLAGFVLWFWKVQRHEDAILRAERAKLERENRRNETVRQGVVHDALHS